MSSGPLDSDQRQVVAGLPTEPPNSDQQIYDLLPEAAQKLARTPRYGLLIANLDASRFSKLVDKASSYWEVHSYVSDKNDGATGILDDGLRAEQARWLGFEKVPQIEANHLSPHIRRKQTRLAMAILGAIAFEMTWPAKNDEPDEDDELFEADALPPRGGDDDDGESLREEVTGIADVSQFRDNVRDRLADRDLGDFIYYLDDAKSPIAKDHFVFDWECLQAMNSHGLNHLTLNAFDETIRFKDITLQAFFAAHWACNYATNKDRDAVLSRLLYVRRDQDGQIRNVHERFREFWEFVWQMPDEAKDKRQWVRLISTIYDPSRSAQVRDDHDEPIRSSELIYRTWDQMDGTKAKHALVSQFAALVHSDVDTPQRRIARELIWQDGVVDGESSFLSLCRRERGDEDNGIFPSGGDVTATLAGQSVEHYRLHRFCVTNEEFELFWPGHRKLRDFESKVSSVDRHPVVNVSWYDAWCFAQWIGQLTVGEDVYCVELPSETQWEYACRCGQNTPFTWDAGRDGTKIEAAYCNFYGPEPWSSTGADVEKGSYRGHTIEVNGKVEQGEALPHNRWGFSQMHGNVWEWCSEWYDAEAILRVLRGGSWINYGRSCRSGSRDRDAPGFRNRYSGFRLVAVPVEPSKSSSERSRRLGDR